MHILRLWWSMLLKKRVEALVCQISTLKYKTWEKCSITGFTQRYCNLSPSPQTFVALEKLARSQPPYTNSNCRFSLLKSISLFIVFYTELCDPQHCTSHIHHYVFDQQGDGASLSYPGRLFKKSRTFSVPVYWPGLGLRFCIGGVPLSGELPGCLR